MCELRIGRIGAGLVGVRAATLELDGETVRIDGHVLGDSADVLAVSEQLRALNASVDEPFIPIWWQVDDCTECEDLTRLNGYYVVTGVGVSVPKITRLDVSLSAQRVRGFSAPLFEDRLLGAQRAGHTGTPSFWHSLPDASTGYEQGSVTPTMTPRDCEPPHPYLVSRKLTVFAHEQLANSRVDFYTPPSDWYLGAPSLEVDGSVVVGRQVRQSPRWTLSNGVVRVYGVEGSGAVMMERWDGLRWVEVGPWHVTRPVDSGGTTTHTPIDAPHAFTVLHNSAELVSIRLSSDAASMYPGSRFVVNLDLTQRRGSAFVEVTLSTRGAYNWGYFAPIPSAGRTNGASWTASASGVIGSRMPTAGVVWSPDGLTARTSDFTGRQRVQWLWGVVPTGETAANVFAQYLAAMTERVGVVAR